MATASKNETFPIQMLGLSMIVVDHSIQSRVSTSVEFQREFSEAMLRGDEFPPVTVFFDGKKYWLADGFHRHGSRKTLARTDKRFEQIKAEVRPGTREDAILFSAGANQKFSIPRKPEDIEKSIGLLLSLPGWKDVTVTRIMNHVGVDFSTAKKHRYSYFKSIGEEPPVLLKDESGTTHYCSPVKPSKRIRVDLAPGLSGKKDEVVNLILSHSAQEDTIKLLSVPFDPSEAAKVLVRHFQGDQLRQLVAELTAAIEGHQP